MQELRLAFRALRRSPGFTLTAAATLALAIGANTAMFSVLNAVLFRPLPLRAPEQLVMLWTENPGQQIREGRSEYADVAAWQRESRSLADLAVFDTTTVTLTGRDGAEQIATGRVTPNFFALLGAQPALGRAFSAADAEERQAVALISDRLWRARFNASPDIVGATVSLNDRPFRIIGVMPPRFQVARLDPDVWLPVTASPNWSALATTRGEDLWFVIGRLRAGVTLPQAQAEMTAVARRLDATLPEAYRSRGISLVPFTLYAVGADSRLALWMLAGAVCCVLLIAAANVASLTLARGIGRVREMAVRVALGASSARIIRQLLVESVTLATIAGVAGTGLAFAAIRLIRAFGPVDLLRLNEVGLDLRVLAWAWAISLLTGVLVGLAPAITMVRRDLRPSGAEGGRSVSGGVVTRRIRRALVVSEFALAIVLLVGAGLLIRSWQSLQRVDPGFNAERVLTMQVSSPVADTPAQRVALFDRLLADVAPLPGVRSAGYIGDLFIGNSQERALVLEGEAGLAAASLRVGAAEISPTGFDALGTSLLRGRPFAASDGPDAPRVAIINETMARRLWPGRDPIGRRFKLGDVDSTRPWLTIVGIVRDMRRQGLEREPIAQLFQPLAQSTPRNVILLVRTAAADPLTLAGAVRGAVRRVEPRAAVADVMALDEAFGEYLAQRRFQTGLLIGFSLVALLMAAIGIYGLVQYSVATRTHEIGIRMAIGARAADIFRMTIREGLQLSLAGLLLGLVGALWVGRAGASLLYGVTATDPLTFAAVSLLLTAVALAACFVPARRAMRVQPIVALRRE